MLFILVPVITRFILINVLWTFCVACSKADVLAIVSEVLLTHFFSAALEPLDPSVVEIREMIRVFTKDNASFGCGFANRRMFYRNSRSASGGQLPEGGEPEVPLVLVCWQVWCR